MLTRISAGFVFVVGIATVFVVFLGGNSGCSPSPSTTSAKDDFFLAFRENPEIKIWDRKKIRPILLDTVRRWKHHESLAEQLAAIQEILPFADGHLTASDRKRYRFNYDKEGPCIICIDLSFDLKKILDVKWVNCEH